jgi:hypothetical protein
MTPPPLPQAAELLGQLESLQKITRVILARNLDGGPLTDDTALKAVREASRLLGQQVELTVTLQQATAAAEYDRAAKQLERIMAALARFPPQYYRIPFRPVAIRTSRALVFIPNKSLFAGEGEFDGAAGPREAGEGGHDSLELLGGPVILGRGCCLLPMIALAHSAALASRARP